MDTHLSPSQVALERATMEFGIDRLGVHIPRWSIERSSLAACWGSAGAAGRRSVANWDEDTLTMGIDAARQIVTDDNRSSIQVVIFATTTPVFTERQHASSIAAALRLAPRTTFDLTGSLRCGIDAVRVAIDLIRSTPEATALVVVADQRALPPGSRLEQLSGDGAAAVLVTSAPELLTIMGSGEISDPSAATWRRRVDSASQIGDERFVGQMLLAPWLTEASTRAMSDACVTPDVIGTAVFCSPLPSGTAEVGKRLGIAIRPEASGVVSKEIGYTGAAAPFVELAVALSDREENELIVVAAAGDGASALVGRTTSCASHRPELARMVDLSTHRRTLDIGSWLRFREQVPVDAVDPSTSNVLMWREADSVWRLEAGRCQACGTVAFPRRRICVDCRSKDVTEAFELPRVGELFTFTVEHLYPVPEGRLIMGVVDLGVCHFYTQVTDTEADECEIGATVELTLRRLHNGGGVPHYFWKARTRAGLLHAN